MLVSRTPSSSNMMMSSCSQQQRSYHNHHLSDDRTIAAAAGAAMATESYAFPPTTEDFGAGTNLGDMSFDATTSFGGLSFNGCDGGGNDQMLTSFQQWEPNGGSFDLDLVNAGAWTELFDFDISSMPVDLFPSDVPLAGAGAEVAAGEATGGTEAVATSDTRNHTVDWSQLVNMDRFVQSPQQRERPHTATVLPYPLAELRQPPPPEGAPEPLLATAPTVDGAIPGILQPLPQLQTSALDATVPTLPPVSPAVAGQPAHSLDTGFPDFSQGMTRDPARHGSHDVAAPIALLENKTSASMASAPVAGADLLPPKALANRNGNGNSNSNSNSKPASVTKTSTSRAKNVTTVRRLAPRPLAPKPTPLLPSTSSSTITSTVSSAQPLLAKLPMAPLPMPPQPSAPQQVDTSKPGDRGSLFGASNDFSASKPPPSMHTFTFPIKPAQHTTTRPSHGDSDSSTSPLVSGAALRSPAQLTSRTHRPLSSSSTISLGSGSMVSSSPASNTLSMALATLRATRQQQQQQQLQEQHSRSRSHHQLSSSLATISETAVGSATRPHARTSVKFFIDEKGRARVEQVPAARTVSQNLTSRAATSTTSPSTLSVVSTAAAAAASSLSRHGRSRSLSSRIDHRRSFAEEEEGDTGRAFGEVQEQPSPAAAPGRAVLDSSSNSNSRSPKSSPPSSSLSSSSSRWKIVALPDPVEVKPSASFYASMRSLSERTSRSLSYASGSFGSNGPMDVDATPQPLCSSPPATTTTTTTTTTLFGGVSCSGGDAVLELRRLLRCRPRRSGSGGGGSSGSNSILASEVAARPSSTSPSMSSTGRRSSLAAELRPQAYRTMVRCICDSTVEKDCEYMVQCECCEMWLHGRCLKIDCHNHPRVYICGFCTDTVRPQARQSF